ncbi:MAG: glucose-1-phosphate adenylyltransferase [Armatimonadota bacterium]
MSIDPRKVYALILGGGAGKRLFPLTKSRAKPAVQIAGKYRLIDIPISNCLNSSINNLFILTQFNSRSLHRHIHHVYQFGVFSSGYVDILAAELSEDRSDWYQGTADAVRANLWHLKEPRMSHVLILSGDQIYRMNYLNLLATHERTQADVTVAVTPKHPDEAEGLGLLKVDRDFRVVDFVEKPSRAAMESLILQGEDLAPMGVQAKGPVVLASMGIYVFGRRQLDAALDNDMADFGKHVIPRCVESMRVFVHPFDGYWEDVGTIQHYFQANLDLAGPNPEFNFYDEENPIYTHPRFLPNNKVEDSTLHSTIVTEGCLITGATITRAVIGVRGIVRDGSVLEDVIVMGQDNYETAEEAGDPLLSPRGIGHNCRITRAIIDKNTRICDDVIIESHLGQPDEDGDCYYVRDGIVIIPKNAVVPTGRHIAPLAYALSR